MKLGSVSSVVLDKTAWRHNSKLLMRKYKMLRLTNTDADTWMAMMRGIKISTHMGVYVIFISELLDTVVCLVSEVSYF